MVNLAQGGSFAGKASERDRNRASPTLGCIVGPIIGTLNEGPLHAALKARYACRPIASMFQSAFVADIVRDAEDGGDPLIIEIQTGSWRMGLLPKAGRQGTVATATLLAGRTRSSSTRLPPPETDESFTLVEALT